MTVQGVKGNEQQNNWLLPTAGAGVIGGGLGATVLAPAKYKSFEDLVADATKDDKFEMPKAADNATDDVKKAFTSVQTGIENSKKANEAIGGLFKEGVTEVEAKDVVTAIGKSVPENVAEKKQVVALNEIISKMTKDSDVEISDEMKNIFKGADDKLPENAEDSVKTLWKTATGVDFPADKKVTETMIDGAKKNGEEAAKYLDDNKAVIEFIEQAGEGGKVTREAAETFTKNADTATTQAFETIQKQLGKNRVKGALMLAAAGAAAGWLVSKFMGNKAEKSV